MKTLAVLGRETLLCQAELEAICGQGNVTVRGDVAMVESSAELNIDTLGGSIKLAEVLDVASSSVGRAEIAALISRVLGSAKNAGEGKTTFGLSVYGQNKLSPRFLQSIGLETKKILRQNGASVRLVQAKTGLVLNAAQLKYNNLTTKGSEIILYFTPSELYVAKTYGFQDVDSYSKRDWDRPVRDSKVGMLPPKLAQIMLNLAKPRPDQPIYDPFCGNGVILQEALLMGHSVHGSDISDDMVSASLQNLAWLKNNYSIHGQSAIWQADATKIDSLPANSLIVTEGYLGTPIHEPLRHGQQESIVRPTNELYSDFLKNLRPLLKPGNRLVVSFPTWMAKGNLVHLPVIDQLGQMGYTTEQYSGHNTLVYRRESQFVGREIAVLVVI